MHCAYRITLYICNHFIVSSRYLGQVYSEQYTIGDLYWQLKDSVAKCELLLLRALKFDAQIQLPHTVSPCVTIMINSLHKLNPALA